MWIPCCWQVIEGGGGGRPGGQCYQGGGHQNEGIGRQGHQNDDHPILLFAHFLKCI